MPRLIVTTPDGHRAVVPLQVGKKRLIGSHPRCPVRLPPDVAEPFHCEVFYAFGLWQVRDLGTITGTMVNGRAITEDALATGDTIEIGEARLSFIVEGKRPGARSRRTSPVTRASQDMPSRRRAAARAVPGRSPGALVFVISLALVGLLVVGIVTLGGRPEPVELGDVASTLGASADAEPRGAPFAPSPTAIPQAAIPEAAIPEAAIPEAAIPEAAIPEAAPLSPSDPPRSVAETVAAETVVVGEPSEPVALASAVEPASLEDGAGPGSAESVPPGDPSQGETSSERPAPLETARWREQVLGALAALDFSEVQTQLEAGRSKGVADDELSAVEVECREVQGVWDELHAALEAAARKKTSFDLIHDGSLVSLAPSATLRVPLKAESGLQVDSLEGDLAEISDARGRSLGFVRVSSLPDEVLLRLLEGMRKPPPEVEREARRRLALFLLHAEGPERTRSFVASGEATAEPGPWIRRRVRTLAIRRLRLEQSADTDSRTWARLSGELLSLLGSTAPTPENEKLIQRLRQDFIKARESSLPLEAVFRASSVERLDDGRVRLGFDFKNEKATLAQAADLHAVGFGSEAPRYLRGRLVLRGEYRLLEGEPFVDRLSIAAKAVPMNPDSANVNVALWTQAIDAVTCLDGEASSWFSLLRQDPGQPADYFVFGMGYRAFTWRLVDQAAEQVVLASSREAVPLPAHVLLGGARGASLHKDLGECLFAEPAPPERTRRVEFLVDFDRGKVTWRVNGRVLALDAEEVQARLQARTSRTGSVSILTNGRPVAFEGLEVTGQLVEKWVEARIQEHVAAELARETPPFASP